MNLNSTHKVSKFDYLVLPPIMALAFYIAFIPHQTYPYPVHIDEWINLAQLKAMLTADSIFYVEPFYGQATLSISSNLEVGYHVFWSTFQRISGLSLLTIFRYFPGIVFMITVLSVYTLAHRQGFGWEAALFTCLMTTTVGILGPAFLVAVAMGLVFVPLSIFLVFNFRNFGAYLTVFIFVFFLLSIHSPSALCLVIIVFPYILLNLRGNFKHSLRLTLALFVPFLILFPWIFDLLLSTAKALLVPQPFPTFIDFPITIINYGYTPVLLCLLGTFVLALRGGTKNYGLVLGLLALLLMLTAFFTFNYGVDIVYTRGLTFMMLMLSIVAGAGLMWVRNLSLPSKIGIPLRAPLVTQNIGKVLCLALIVLTLALAIPARQDTPYYHMINKQDYEAFVWIKDNVSDDYEKAIVDPWKATAFAAVTEKKIFSRIHMSPQPKDEKAASFIIGGCSDTNFLRENDISIVYTVLPTNNPDLTKVRENIYLLKEAK